MEGEARTPVPRPNASTGMQPGPALHERSGEECPRGLPADASSLTAETQLLQEILYSAEPEGGKPVGPSKELIVDGTAWKYYEEADELIPRQHLTKTARRELAKRGFARFHEIGYNGVDVKVVKSSAAGIGGWSQYEIIQQWREDKYADDDHEVPEATWTDTELEGAPEFEIDKDGVIELGHKGYVRLEVEKCERRLERSVAVLDNAGRAKRGVGAKKAKIKKAKQKVKKVRRDLEKAKVSEGAVLLDFEKRVVKAKEDLDEISETPRSG